jgi:hypothetical protein
VVESTSLLTRRAVKGSVGSNPTVSARLIRYTERHSCINTMNHSEIRRGSRSALNVMALSLLVAYVCAFLLLRFLPIPIVAFAPAVILYFVAPMLHKKLAQEPKGASYKHGRIIGLTIGVVIGVIGLIVALDPILKAVHTGTDGNADTIATQAVIVVANFSYLIAFLTGYFRST